MTPDMLNLTDEAYWEDPTSTLVPVCDQLNSQQINGVVIGAPANVSLDSRQTLPIVAYRGGSYFDVRSLPLSIHGILACVDLERNAVQFARAMEVQDLSGSPGSQPVPQGYTASPYVIDARERLALPWRPGTYMFSIIMRDRVSNRVKVSLGKSAQGFRDEEVEKFIDAYRRQQFPLPIEPEPGDPLPSYRQLPESPAVPAKNGVAVKIDRVLLLNRETRWNLHGAFRLAVLPREIVRRPPPKVDQKEAVPTAITRITLLAVGAESGRWTPLELRVPSYDPIDPALENPVVTGYFSFDLLKEARHLAFEPQTYFLYVFSGEILAGPIPSALVPESRLLMER